MKSRIIWTIAIFGMFALIASLLLPFERKLVIEPETIAEKLDLPLRAGKFPNTISIAQSKGTKINAHVRYTLDFDLQNRAKKLFETHKPDYGALVAMDPGTGRIIALVDFSRKDVKDIGNVSLLATFPAASIFKIVTAAAVIDQRKISPESIISFNGKSHTLYKSNVQKSKRNRWTRYISLREAFARSINTVFGKLGVFYLSDDILLDYAKRFGFNQDISVDFNLDQSVVVINKDDPWSLAETASGFTRKTTMSAVHGAALAATIINDGVMMRPYLVETLLDDDGKVLYNSKPRIMKVSIDSLTADEMQDLMKETVIRGTTRATFRTLFHKRGFEGIVVGGKTGSLTGRNPKGKCDWFSGYASFNGSRIAIATLTVHKKYWRVKSSYLARKFIEDYFSVSRRKHKKPAIASR